MNNILYVTTSTEKMYNLSGIKLINKRLLESLQVHQRDRYMFEILTL